jgi:hypothetical protein
LLAQQSINFNKVACIRISQEQTVFKTKKKQRSSTNFIYLKEGIMNVGCFESGLFGVWAS